MKRIATLLLCALLLLPLAACGESAAPAASNVPAEQTNDGGTTDAVEETVDPLEARQAVSDDLEDTDYEGRTFVILGDDGSDAVFPYLVEEENGDALQDSIYTRNFKVMERFNIVLDEVIVGENDLVGKVQSSALAGDDAYQLTSGHILYLAKAVAKGLYCNWYDIPNIDFSKPWWSSSTAEDLTYDGKTCIAIGDFGLTSLSQTYATFFNKKLAENYQLPDLYELTNAGEWTYAKQLEFAQSCSEDLNGDGVMNENDRYGYVIWSRTPINVYLWSFGEKLMKKQSDGTLLIDCYNEKTADIFLKMYQLLYECPGSWSTSLGEDQELTFDMFMQDQAIFYPYIVEFAGNELRSCDTDYGIIPYPKLDEAQDSYATMVDGGHDGLIVPISVADPEFAGTIIEALCAESWKNTVPVYYDIVLKTKGVRDEESIAVLDLIFETRVFDFGYIYGMSSAGFWLQKVVGMNKSYDIASHYEANHASFEKMMNDAIDFYTSME